MGKRFSDSEKESIVDYADRRSVKEAANKYDVSESTIYRWLNKEDSSSCSSGHSIFYYLFLLIIWVFSILVKIIIAPFKLISTVNNKKKDGVNEDYEDDVPIPGILIEEDSDEEISINKETEICEGEVTNIDADDEPFIKEDEDTLFPKVGYDKKLWYSSAKYKKIAIILCLFTGWFGGHRFYVKKYATAILYLLMLTGSIVSVLIPENEIIPDYTCGLLITLLELLCIIDFVKIIFGKFEDKENKKLLFWSKKTREKYENKLKEESANNELLTKEETE